MSFDTFESYLRRQEDQTQTALGGGIPQVDITLVEIVALLREQHGVSFAPSSVWRLLDRHGVTIKKNSARQRAGQARRRRAATRLVQSAA